MADLTKHERPAYCKCAFTDPDGTFVPGEACAIHPDVTPQRTALTSNLRSVRRIRQTSSLLIGDLQAGTAVNDHGYTYIGLGPISDDVESAIEIDHIEAAALYEWLGRALGLAHETSTRLPLRLNAYQLKQALDLCGGEEDTELVFLKYAEDRQEPGEHGDPMPAGTYCWFPDYPEEGQLLLKEERPEGSSEETEPKFEERGCTTELSTVPAIPPIPGEPRLSQKASTHPDVPSVDPDPQPHVRRRGL